MCVFNKKVILFNITIRCVVRILHNEYFLISDTLWEGRKKKVFDELELKLLLKQ